jgi:hypothetical protein
VHLFMHDRPAYPMLHINWAMGYLEALNFSALTHGEDTRQIFLPSTELDRLLVNYCRLHPDDEVAFGVVKLYEQMPIIPGSQAEISAKATELKSGLPGRPPAIPISGPMRVDPYNVINWICGISVVRFHACH